MSAPALNKCPGMQASLPAFKEVRSPGRTIACPGTQANSPAPLVGRGSGGGACPGTQASPPANTQIIFE